MTRPITINALSTICLRLLALFMLGEAIYHASGLRLLGVETHWPASAILFSRFFMTLWASFSLLSSVLFWKMSQRLELYRDLMIPLILVFIIHSGILYYFSFQQFETVFPEPSMYMYNPIYSWQMRLEALALNVVTLALALRRFEK